MEGVIRNLTAEEVSACRTLGLDTVTTKKELKSRYRQLALKNHPDKGGNEETFKKIVNSYEILNKVTPIDCSQMNNREYKIVHNWIFGDMREETEVSRTRRYSKYAPDGFTAWREYL